MVVNGLREDYILKSEKLNNHIIFAACWSLSTRHHSDAVEKPNSGLRAIPIDFSAAEGVDYF